MGSFSKLALSIKRVDQLQLSLWLRLQLCSVTAPENALNSARTFWGVGAFKRMCASTPMARAHSGQPQECAPGVGCLCLLRRQSREVCLCLSPLPSSQTDAYQPPCKTVIAADTRLIEIQIRPCSWHLDGKAIFINTHAAFSDSESLSSRLFSATWSFCQVFLG